jgi:signal transduction histidine kinase
MAVKEKNKAVEAKLYMNLGLIYARQQKLETGLEYMWKSLPIAELSGNKLLYSTILSNIGAIYRSMKNNNQALYYLEQAKTIDEELDFPLGLMTVYLDLGAIYRSQKEFDKALDYCLKALKLSRSVPDKETEGYANQYLTIVYMDMAEYDKAEESSKECMRIAEEFGDPRQITGAWNALSNVYMAQERYQEGETAALNAWNLDSADLDVGRNITANIARANIFLGNKEKANRFFDKYEDIIEKYTDKNFYENITDMEVKYETEKKEMRIASLEKEQQLYVWLGITGFLLALSLGIVLWQKMKNARKEKLLIATRSVLDGEMGERARLSRDLHDRLSGNLAAVKIGLSSDTESLHNICEKLDGCIEEIRRAAHNLMPTSLQFGMRTAIEDFATRFSNVHFYFYGEERRIEERKEFIIYCCANELVNNAIRHAKAENINVQLMQNEKFISLTVQDDGCGFDEKIAATGIGLKNIRDRVTSCNGKIDVITSPGNGTEITIEVKAQEKS